MKNNCPLSSPFNSLLLKVVREPAASKYVRNAETQALHETYWTIICILKDLWMVYMNIKVWEVLLYNRFEEGMREKEWVEAVLFTSVFS